MVRLRNGRSLTTTMNITKRSKKMKMESPIISLSEYEAKLKSTDKVKLEAEQKTVKSEAKQKTVKIKLESKSKAVKLQSKAESKTDKIKSEIKVKTPRDWKKIHVLIQEMRQLKVAAVDTMGCDTFTELELQPHENRFQTLIAAMLSSQTKDAVNAGAMMRLKTHGLTIDKIIQTEEDVLATLIHPVSFYKNKAKFIKNTCLILQKAAQDKKCIDIPETLLGLQALPGVGPKMAHLVMTCAWGKTEGICVDIHVHRIANRLGWVNTWKKNTAGNSKGQDPEKTRKELEGWLPREHWGTINPLLVGFGQTVCTPLRPSCSSCKINSMCPSAFKA